MNTRYVAIAAVAVAGALGLAACGGEADQPASAPSAPAPAEPILDAGQAGGTVLAGQALDGGQLVGMPLDVAISWVRSRDGSGASDARTAWISRSPPTSCPAGSRSPSRTASSPRPPSRKRTRGTPRNRRPCRPRDGAGKSGSVPARVEASQDPRPSWTTRTAQGILAPCIRRPLETRSARLAGADQGRAQRSARECGEPHRRAGNGPLARRDALCRHAGSRQDAEPAGHHRNDFGRCRGSCPTTAVPSRSFRVIAW